MVEEACMTTFTERTPNMENKKTFGSYIQQKRRDLGLTQRAFADQLYVTESAVSKWERGLSYPDVTLLMSICQVLGVSEHELLTASTDIEARTTEKLARKYRRLTKTYRVIQYAAYGGTLLGCGIGNLCAQGRLDWFFIVLASVLLAASLTLLPSLLTLRGLAEKRIWPVCILSALGSLLLLLGICCLYSGGSWFFVAAAGVILGFCVVFVPFILPGLPLPAALAGRKTSLCLILDLASLLVLLAICCLSTGGRWFFVAAVSVVFGLGFFLLPVFLHQLPLPQPLGRHKALLYFGVQTALLIALLAMTVRPWEAFFRIALPLVLLIGSLPWGLMLIIRYFPGNGLVRAGAACGLGCAWTFFFPAAMDTILTPLYGPGTNSLRGFLRVDLLHWADPMVVVNNVYVLILIGLGILALGLLAAGLRKRKSK